MNPQGEPATVLVSTTSDLASRTLAGALIGEQGFVSTGVELFGNPVYQKGSLLLVFFEGIIVFPPDLDQYFNPQAYVFLSRHSAESGIPSLTAHTVGNLSSEAKFGGNAREVGRCDPGLLKDYMRALAKRRERIPDYEVTLEATHHGPTSLQKPVLFVELGSSEKYWGDKEAASVVGESLVACFREREIWAKTAIGFGGTHYPEKFTRMVVEEDIAVSYCVPKHALGEVDEELLGQMIQKSASPVKYAAVDWKGLGKHKEKITGLVSKFGLETIRV